MQIIPTKSAGFGLDLWSNADKAPQSDSPYADFLQSIHEAIESVERGRNVSVDAALKNSGEQVKPLVQGPYSRNSVDGVTYTLDEVCFTKKELHELRRELIKAGAPVESLRKFDALADQPDGATLAQVMASLQSFSAPEELSDEDASNITALLGKIDSTGDLAAQALQLMSEGRGQDALALISESFAALDPGETIEISRDEALSLGRGLGLDRNSLQKLSDSFGGYPALRSTSEQFSNLMAPATARFAEEAAQRQKLEAALEQTLKPIISKARDRMEKEKAATALKNREVEQSKVLINKTVQEESREILDQTLRTGQEAGQPGKKESQDPVRQSNAVSRKVDESQSAMVGGAGKGEKKNQPDKRAAGKPLARDEAKTETPRPAEHAADANAEAFSRAASNAGSAVNSRDNAAADAPDPAQGVQPFAFGTGRAAATGNEAAQGDARNGEQGKGKEWSELLHKVDVSGAAPKSQNNNSIVFSMLQGGPGAPVAPETGRGADAQPLSRQVAQQVEQGLLSALKGGGTRLDLQLNPQELGAITLTLTVRNGEVSARIRSEKTETAEMVTRQLDAIRANLEQQGIKVDKIEVQLENRQQDDGRQWQDLDQHNSRQEEDARREELARLKNIITIRNSNRNSEIETLEQPVHSLTQTARYATRSLHVVA